MDFEKIQCENCEGVDMNTQVMSNVLDLSKKVLYKCPRCRKELEYILSPDWIFKEKEKPTG